MNYFDRAGRPMSVEEWTAARALPDYRRIAEAAIGDVWVSTVWLGLDYNFTEGGPPIIFETMIFPEHEYCVRTSTEEAALAAHEYAVAHVNSGAYAAWARSEYG